MSEITCIEGGVFIDERGRISFVNDFVMDEVRRFYVIRQADPAVVRAWHAHRYEKKFFYVLKGAFTLAFVKIDDWENPSPDLKAEIFQVTDRTSRILCIPEGYANAVKADEPDSILIVFSNKVLSNAVTDSWRYDQKMWVDWSALPVIRGKQ